MLIRTATDSDRDSITNIYLRAFPENEKDIVSKLAIDLLDERTTPETLSLVAETDGAVVGHVAFSPVKIFNNDDLLGYTLAPLAVLPDYQKQRIGTQLVESGKNTLLETGTHILFVYGDPDYYGRFGFNAKEAELNLPQYKLQYPFGWLALMLNRYSGKRSPGNLVCVASLNNPDLW